MAQVHRPTRTWSPKLEVDGVPIAWDASLRHYRGRHAGHLAEALEQPLLLPKNMEAYRNFNHPKPFLSLKRDLAMVGYLSQAKFLQLNSIMPPYPLGEGGAALEPRYMTGVPPTVMPKGSIPGNGHTVHLQLR